MPTGNGTARRAGPDRHLETDIAQENRVFTADEHDFPMQTGNAVNPGATRRTQVADGQHICAATQSCVLAVNIRTVDDDIDATTADHQVDGSPVNVAGTQERCAVWQAATDFHPALGLACCVTW